MKFLTLLFLAVVFISCGNGESKDSSESPEEVSQQEGFYTITVKRNNTIAQGNQYTFDFGEASTRLDFYEKDSIKKTFNSEELAQNNWCITLHESDFSDLSIKLEVNIDGELPFKDLEHMFKKVVCDNDSDTTLEKCSEIAGNLFLNWPIIDLANQSIFLFYDLLNKADEKNPEMDKCYKYKS